MKVIFLTILVFLMNGAFAKDCEVYGISDSPQKLTCDFQDLPIGLRCKNGIYYLNTSRVSMAFHMEVEEGPTPLVFKAPDMEMTVLINSKTDIQAELVRKGRTLLRGQCQF